MCGIMVARGYVKIYTLNLFKFIITTLSIRTRIFISANNDEDPGLPIVVFLQNYAQIYRD